MTTLSQITSTANSKGQIFTRAANHQTVPEQQIAQALLDKAHQQDWTEPSD